MNIKRRLKTTRFRTMFDTEDTLSRITYPIVMQRRRRRTIDIKQ